MITYEIVNADEVAARFELMENRLENFKLLGIPQGLTDWQVTDMHRKYPNTTHEPDGASTIIRPRSIIPSRHRPKPKGIVRRKVVMKQSGRLNNIGRPRSTRPILRVMLYDRLVDRMEKLVNDTLNWALGGH